MRLIPREEKFFRSFLDQVRVIGEAARALLAGVEAGNSHMSSAANTIRMLEQQGDEIIHDIFTRLNSTFITPLDPEDIHSLASHLDDVTDGIEEAAHRIAAYRVEPIPQEVKDVCRLIVACGDALHEAFQALSNDKPLLEHCIEINRLEDQADGIVRTAIADLFRTEKDPIQVLKLKEVYEMLESTTDCAEDVADVLQGVMVKNS
jgi:predicted phosphate transport protein (TIGR00153 family)